MGERRGPKRTKIVRERDIVEATAMYVRGKSHRVIADKLGLSRQQVGKDLQVVRKRWLASQVTDFAERQAVELERLDHLESVAWDAWERSCKPAKKEHREFVHVGDDEADTQRGWREKQCRDGDPRFLERVAWCIDRRCKLLGLDPNVRGDGDLVDATEEEIAELEQRYGVPPPVFVMPSTEAEQN